MIIESAGHRYKLESFQCDPQGDPIYENKLQFIEKRPIPGDKTGALNTVCNGTTNEEVLKVLIDRMKFLNDKFPCRENSIVITKLEESLMWLNKRTEDRKSRGVEGKQIK